MKKYILLMLMGTVFVGSGVKADENIAAEKTTQQIEQVEKEAKADMMRKHHRKDINKVRENFAKKLDLTEEQQEKVSAIHQKSKDEMDDIKKQMKELRQKADIIRENNKKEFEAILTDDQKKKLEKIKQENKLKMKKHHKGMYNNMKNK